MVTEYLVVHCTGVLVARYKISLLISLKNHDSGRFHKRAANTLPTFECFTVCDWPGHYEVT